jgi:hypothetical protein
MEWKESNASQLNRYNHESGGALIKLLLSRLPKLKGTTIEEVALNSKFKEGYEEAINDILFALEPVKRPTDGANGGFTSFN